MYEVVMFVLVHAAGNISLSTVIKWMNQLWMVSKLEASNT